MRCAVQAGECPVCVDQAHDEGDSVGRPASVVDKVGEHEPGFLVGRRPRRNCYDDDQEREKGGVEGDRCDRGQDFSVAVEEEAESIDQLIGDDDMPCLDDATHSFSSVSRKRGVHHTSLDGPIGSIQQGRCPLQERRWPK